MCERFACEEGTFFLLEFVLFAVRMQLGAGGTTNPFLMAKQMLAKEGLKIFYKGLSAGILRQLTYSFTYHGFSTLLFFFVCVCVFCEGMEQQGWVSFPQHRHA